MSPARPPKNLGASVRARLLELARRRGAEFQLVLSELLLWRAFLRRGRLDGPPDAAQLAEALQRFLGPVLTTIAHGEPFSARWQIEGPWEAES